MSNIILHVALIANPDNSFLFGLAKTKRDAKSMYKDLPDTLIIDYSQKQIFGDSEKCFVVLHTVFERTNFDERDRHAICTLIAELIMMDLFSSDTDPYFDVNSNFEGLQLIVAE